MEHYFNSLMVDPHPSLHRPTHGFENDCEQYREALYNHMVTIMQTFNGVGLAANQIDLDEAVFVFMREGHEKVFMAINPEISFYSKEQELGEEGCLSLPYHSAMIKRPKMILASWENIDGEKTTVELEGITARIFQHEYDHLQGILFPDRLSKFKRDRMKKKADKLLKRHIQETYGQNPV